MKHLFLPYNLALLAKEKGFDEPCFATYSTNDRKLSGLPLEAIEGALLYTLQNLI